MLLNIIFFILGDFYRRISSSQYPELLSPMVPMWFVNMRCKSELKQFSVAYHKAIKKILKVPNGVSNHECCQILNLLTFEHFINFNKFRFIYNIFKKPCSFIWKNLSFLLRNSIFLKETTNIYQMYIVYIVIF